MNKQSFKDVFKINFFTESSIHITSNADVHDYFYKVNKIKKSGEFF